MAFPEHRRLGQYNLVRRLAVGGMADIFLATARGRDGGDWPLVLKMVHDSHSLDPDFVDALVNEAQIAVQLTHPNIVRFFDLGRAEGNYFLAMEYVDGVDLSTLLARAREAGRTLPFPATAFIVREISLALHYAHACRDQNGRPLNIVHRDVSPHNILIGYTGGVKLADFGIAKAAISHTQTAANIVKGKFDYMSPEHAWGERIDARADVFSLGVVLFQMLTGRLPFDDDDSPDLVRRLHSLHNKPIASAREIRPDIPEQLDAIAVKALHRERDQRFASAREMGRALSDYLAADASTFTATSLARIIVDLYPRSERSRHDLPPVATRVYDHDALDELAEATRDESSLIVVFDTMAMDTSLATIVDDTLRQAPTERVPVSPPLLPRPRVRPPSAPPSEGTSEFDIVTTLYMPERHSLTHLPPPPPEATWTVSAPMPAPLPPIAPLPPPEALVPARAPEPVPPAPPEAASRWAVLMPVTRLEWALAIVVVALLVTIALKLVL